MAYPFSITDRSVEFSNSIANALTLFQNAQQYDVVEGRIAVNSDGDVYEYSLKVDTFYRVNVSHIQVRGTDALPVPSDLAALQSSLAMFGNFAFIGQAEPNLGSVDLTDALSAGKHWANVKLKYRRTADKPYTKLNDTFLGWNSQAEAQAGADRTKATTKVFA